ncbi:MAG: hypothetical protein KDM91_08380, partial [Verrucomicrobiae bacterium]|nr:hypothetical protein [Verrucomicrobiae bacterium]
MNASPRVLPPLGALVASASLVLFAVSARAELPLVLKEDFSGGSDRWEPTDSAAWKIAKLTDGNAVFEILGGSKYEPPHRSPVNFALLKNVTLGDFVLTAKVKTTQTSRAHRDMCLFFGFQDPAHFYYVHLGEKTDDHANQIFIVNDAPRVKISEKTTEGTPWKDDFRHSVKLVREAATGLIEVYFDDLENPAMVAHDTRFAWGRVGIGTFDDKGQWDDIEIHGTEVEKPSAAAAVEPAEEKSADTGAENEDAEEAASLKEKKRIAGSPSAQTKLKYTKWTPKFQVPDPVAIDFDEKGRAYVTQTQRRKANDLDIRANTDWIPNDVGFTSVEEKRAFFRERLTKEQSEANAGRVDDLNGDGVHDWRDLTVLTERVHRVADTDGDGFADEMKTYAEDFRTEVTGIAAGVMFHEGDVYSTIAPDVWKLRDTDDDGVADRREVFAHGFGLHIAYAGHDMHGLIVGPDGRVYWSIGDKGIHVKTREGDRFFFPNQGGMLRCEPDGGHFEVFAHGLRNVQEPAFDAHGNFFGVDNDSDASGEKERFVYIVRHMDAGWRANWQYRKPDFNPWIDEGLWETKHPGQAAHLVPPISHYENGPAGFVYNPGTALDPTWRDFFFLTSAPNGQQWAFRAKEKGVTFEMTEDRQIGDGIPLVGLAFAPEGGLYGVDWGGGYPLNQQGAVWRIDVPGAADSELRRQTAEKLRDDYAKLKEGELVARLGDDDQRVRLKAQFELARREAFDTFAAVAADAEKPRLARLHALWGLGQLTRHRDGADYAPLLARLDDPDAEVRTQAAKTIGDGFGAPLAFVPVPFATQQGMVDDLTLLSERLIPLLRDGNDRVKFHAALALANLARPEAAAAFVEFANSLPAPDAVEPYLRHAAIVGLTACADTPILAGFADAKSETARACAVAALRRRADAAVVVFLDDASPWVATEAALAIHDDWSIPAALPNLAAKLGTHPKNESFTRRAISANHRIGDAPGAGRVAAYAADRAAPETLRLEALDALTDWTKPDLLDRVDGRRRDLGDRDPHIASGAVAKFVDTLLTDPASTIQAKTMRLAADLNLAIPPATLTAVIGNADSADELRIEALRTLKAQAAPELAAAVSGALDAKSVDLRGEALAIFAESNPEAALPKLESVLKNAKAVGEKQRAFTTLGAMTDDASKRVLGQWAADLARAPGALKLDIAAAAEKRGLPVEASFDFCLEGGDPRRGKTIMLSHVAAQCTACHKIADGKGSTVGPNLKSVGLRERAYLLESLVNPMAQIAKGYGTISLTLKNGETIAGQFREEKDGK